MYFVNYICVVVLALCVCLSSVFAGQLERTRIAVVSSYHSEYIWSQQTNEGVLQALLDFGYLQNLQQAREFTEHNQVKAERVVIKKWWLDSKRKSSRVEIATAVAVIIDELDKFVPDIILLGDDNAANYIGNHYLDSSIPVVFWGINGLPLKYGLMDSLEKPGHNITGVYQAGYHLESIRFLKKLFPNIKTMAVLSDDSPSGRSHAKKLKRYAAQGRLGVRLDHVVITNSLQEWQQQALLLKDKVDAFYILTHNTLKDAQGKHVNYLKVAAWYLNNIQKPEITPTSFYVKEGFLSSVDDPAFNQGYEAVRVAHRILSGQAKAADIASYAPERGPFMINRWRAKTLGINMLLERNAEIIDAFIEDSAALQWMQRNEL